MRRACLTATVVLLGCTSADILRVDLTPRSATSASVPLLLEDPAEPYQSIALVEVSGQWMGASLQRLGRRLSSEAAKLGGDAVILTRRVAQSSSTLIPIGETFVPVETEDSRLVGKVIVYRDRARPGPSW
ncbi:MAG: hypothetical protein ACKVZ0_25335 [Gemmatimonadales bacterium]